MKILNFLHEFWPVMNGFCCLLQCRQPELSSASTPSYTDVDFPVSSETALLVLWGGYSEVGRLLSLEEITNPSLLLSYK